MTTREKFLGAWTLLDWTVTETGKPSRQPYGAAPSGYIIYSPQGVMSATLMAENRKHLNASRPEMTSKISKAVRLMWADGKVNDFSMTYFLAASQYLNYCGAYSVVGNRVTHHVETALIPDWIGATLVREFEFRGDRLTLSAHEGGVCDQLVWKRMPDADARKGE